MVAATHTHTHSHSHTYLQSAEEAEMLPNSESVKEYIVLGTNSQTPPDLIHISHNAVAIDQGCPRGGGVQTCGLNIHLTPNISRYIL